MKFAPPPLLLPLIVLVATVFQPTIAQANPPPLVKRSDSAVKMLRSFHDRFGCAPQMAEQRIGFARYEIFSAISTCGNKINEVLASSDVNISREELEHLRQLFSAFRVEIDQVELIQSQAVPLPKYDNKYGSPNTGLRSVVMFMPLESPVLVKRSDAIFQQWTPNTMGTTAQLEALERNQFSHTTKSEATVVFSENSNPKPIAQANPAPLVKRSDAIFHQWTSVRDKFGCVDLPWTPIANPGFTRYEMAAAINACFDRVSEFVTGMNVAGMNGLPAASPEDAKTLEPLLTEFAAEITTLRGRVAAVSDLASRKIVVYTPSGRTIVPYEQFVWHWPSAEYIGPDYDPNAPPRKPAPRSIDAWIIPALKELQSRYGCPNNRIQITNPSDLSSSRYEVAAIINACAEDYHKGGVKLRKIDADDFLNMQRLFPEELVTLQERNREIQRQKCLAQPCE
jgi:hypothetical protein